MNSRKSILGDRTRASALPTATPTLLIGACVSAALCGLPEPAHGQGTGAGALDAIVVTAQRREQSIQDVPVSISAFSAEDLEARVATSLSDLSSFTPNFNFANYDSGMNLHIRGVGSSDASLFFDPGVGVFLDGVYLPRLRGLDLDLVGIERIEILRGPQGTLFGKNTIGGAISVVSKRPGDEFSGTAEVTTGRFNRLDARFGIDGPIVPGKLSGQLAGVIRKRDGYGRRIDFATGEKIGETGNQDSFSARASLNWTPREDVDVLFVLDGTSAHEQGGVHHLVATPAPTSPNAPVAMINAFTAQPYDSRYLTTDVYETYATGPNFSSVDGWGVTLNVHWDRGTWALRSITSFRHQKTRYGWDNDGSPIPLFEQPFFEDSDQLSQEIQLSGVASDDRLNWVAGLYYADESAMMEAATLVAQPLWTATFPSPPFPPGFRIDASQLLHVWSDAWSAAAFGQGTYKLTDKLSFTAGARYSYDWKELGRQRQRINSGVIHVPYGKLDDNWSAVTGRLGFEYRQTDDVMYYVSAARGYKSGGINAAGVTTLEFTGFDPEYLTTYEVGLRSDWLERRLRFNASVFFSDYEDLQLRSVRADPTGQPINLVGNVAAAEVTGFELELTALPAPGLELTASVGYLDARYTRVEPGTPVTTAMEFLDTPEYSFALSGQYTHPLAGGAEVTGRVDYSYTAEQQRGLTNTPLLVQDAYSMVNARIAWRSAGSQWEVALFGTNLTDERVMTFGFDLSSLGFVDAQYGPPRQWGASVRYNF